MPLITLLDAELAFGLHPLLDRAALTVRGGERVGLIGRNGTGKSSLLRVIAAGQALDGGEIRRRDGLRIVLIEQEPELPGAATLRDSLAIRGRFEHIADERERWRTEVRLVEFLHRFELDEGLRPEAASGGERKRAALALALALEPQLLLLDEPTNHLDIDGISRLEDLLLKGPACIVITHDRAFLDRVATRIVELDRGLLRSYPGNFAAYESRKSDELAAEATEHRRFDKFWAQEEVWIRKGVEARRTRNAGRVSRLEDLRRARAARRERMGSVRLTLDAGERSGKLVAELAGVCKRFGVRTVVKDLSLRIMRGDRLGLVGPNGAGKTTVLKLILGALAPDSGTVRLGTNLQVAYFDQMREQLDPARSVADTVAPGSDWVEIGTERKHVVSYLGDFLFPPQRADSPVSMLSGGERNRLLLARLFARPANILVLDEPTNDLDIDSLELLETTLQDYPGTVLLVSHDRAFLDNVVTQTLAAEGDGRWREYVGGYSDWLQQRPVAPPSPAPQARTPVSAGTGRDDGARQSSQGRASTKLTYKETRELAELPARIEALEREQRELTTGMSRPDYHRQGAARMKADAARIDQIEALLLTAYERWEALDAKSTAARQ
ncbi:MAG: ATP-binding cassette domain-containing protein [Steroidobacteraceae bacterium]